MPGGRTSSGEGQRCLDGSFEVPESRSRPFFANLEDGARLDDFLEWFPGVTREQAEAVLKHAERSLAVA